MSRKIRISVIATPVPMQNASAPPKVMLEAVIDHLRREISRVLPDKPDLIVLPEVCDRPPSATRGKVADRFEYYRFRGNRVLEFLSETARENHCYVTYPAVRCLADGTWRNSTQLIDRNGKVIAVYDKYHPTIGENEAGILSGTDAVVAECDFGRVGFAICFDLNFDEIRRKYVAARPDLLLFSSMYHGGLMQDYWAYSARMYFVGAISGVGGFVRSPVGDLIARSTNYYSYVTATVNLDYVVAYLDFNLERLTAMRVKYGPRVRVFDPGYVGAVLITSEAEDVSARDMAREFELELIDDYFARSLASQARHRPQKE